MKTKMYILALFLTVSSLAFVKINGYKVGDVATDFKLKNVDGKLVSLADFPKAKGFILTFTCNHCPYSVAYEDRIIALHKKYADKGYPVVAINSNDPALNAVDNFDGMKQRAKEKGFPFVYLADETQEMGKLYGAMRTPTMFVLQKENNKLVIKYIGAIDDNSEDASAVKEKYVESAVDNLLNGKEVSVNYTKAVGCGIKYKSL